MNHTTKEDLQERLDQQLLCSGSSIKIMEMDEKKVVVKLLGTCKGCPGAQLTIKDTIEVVIKEHIPSVEEVILDISCDEELLEYARQLLRHGK